MDATSQIKLLKTKINHHNIQYYVHDDPIISDSGEISLYFSINPPIDAERHGAIPPLVSIPILFIV